MYSSITLSKPGRNTRLDDNPVAVLTWFVFDIAHRVSRFPAGAGAEAHAVPTRGDSSSLPPV